MSHRRPVFLVCLLVLGACGGDEPAKGGGATAAERVAFKIRDVTADSGLDFVTRSGTPEQKTIAEVKATGVGVLDYDGDGRLDVVLVAGSSLERRRAGESGFGTRLFRNLGGLRFEDVTEKVGLPPTDWACAPICADYDGDGDDDLFVTHLGRNRLFRNEGGRFVDVTDEAGLGDEGWGTSAAFHDIDGDGDLDLYVCNYLTIDLDDPPMHGKKGLNCIWKDMPVMCGPAGLAPQADRVYRNEGDGRFTEVSKEWGLDEVEPSFGLGVVAGDLDGDGRPELYVANDGMANFWFDWDGTRLVEQGFERSVAFGENGDAEAGMGLDACDLNGDGAQDLVCTNFSNEYNNVYVSSPGDDWYREESVVSGSATAAFDHLGWGVGIRDFDLDGRWDYFVANGHVYPQAAQSGTGTDYKQANHLFLGRPEGRFELASTREHPGLAVRQVSRGAAFADLDDDGDVDIVVVNLNARCSLLEVLADRATSGRHFAGFALRQDGANRQAIGALVRLVDAAGATVFAREVRRQSSFQASSDPRVHFGLGSKPEVDHVEVRWPDGTREAFPFAIDRYSELVRGAGRRSDEPPPARPRDLPPLRRVPGRPERRQGRWHRVQPPPRRAAHGPAQLPVRGDPPREGRSQLPEGRAGGRPARRVPLRDVAVEGGDRRLPRGLREGPGPRTPRLELPLRAAQARRARRGGEGL
ncbi:MAG: FG-GAP-like repeat-containing protein [Planctomycetota bacterium]